MSKRHFVLGTAGHIDHGKTALVKALTGVDTDRLKEEKARGLTIDIGFAHFGDSATIIDVPGHEKFIKNMVAGVATIDLVLFVVAADDGVMPQTREHLDILNLLQVRSGLIVITKKDLVDAEWLALVQDDIRQLVQGTFLADAPVFPVSAITGDGIPDLKQAIRDALEALPERHDRGVFWLPVDRSFVMKGFGTVVTGSVLSGSLRVGDTVEMLPQGQTVRVRGLQKHGKAVQQVAIGDRAAINLQNVAREDIRRGDVLASPGYFRTSQRMHARLRLLPGAFELKANTRVRLHLGTAEIMARVTPIGQGSLAPGDSGYVQFTLETPAVARRLDPFVIRQYSPAHTIGGGVILDANARPYRRRDTGLPERLRSLKKEDPEDIIREQLFAAPGGVLAENDLLARTGMARQDVLAILQKMQAAGEVFLLGKKNFLHRAQWERLSRRLLEVLQDFHRQQPMKIGMRKAELAKALGAGLSPLLVNFVFDRAKERGEIVEREGHIALATHRIELSDEQRRLKERLAQQLLAAGFTPPTPEALMQQAGIPPEQGEALLELLSVEKEIVRLDEGMYLHRQRLQEAREKLVDFLRQRGQITVPEFKELIGGASRKYAIPLLNYFDAQQITLREGDVRYPGPEA